MMEAVLLARQGHEIYCIGGLAQGHAQFKVQAVLLFFSAASMPNCQCDFVWLSVFWLRPGLCTRQGDSRQLTSAVASGLQ